MTIKAQKTFFWGLLKRPIRVLEKGDEITRLGMVDPFAKEGVGEVVRVINPDEMVLRQKLVGVPWINERPLKVNIKGKETDRLVREEITQFFEWQTIGGLSTGYRDKAWWEPTPESDMSQARRK